MAPDYIGGSEIDSGESQEADAVPVEENSKTPSKKVVKRQKSSTKGSKKHCKKPMKPKRKARNLSKKQKKGKKKQTARSKKTKKSHEAKEKTSKERTADEAGCTFRRRQKTYIKKEKKNFEKEKDVKIPSLTSVSNEQTRL